MKSFAFSRQSHRFITNLNPIRAGLVAAAALTPIGAYAKSESLGLEKANSWLISSAASAVGLLTGEPTVSLDGSIAFGAITLGLILTVLYLRGMYLVLHYASETYSVSLDAVDDAEYSSRSERRLLYIGSFLLVVLSGLIISAYGFGWFLLYVGPILSLLGPLVIIASMAIDVRKCRRALSELPKHTAKAGVTGTSSVGQELV